MFEVEIKTKRIVDESQVYYEIIPVGELFDKLMYCFTYPNTFLETDILIEAKEILNNKANEL